MSGHNTFIDYPRYVFRKYESLSLIKKYLPVGSTFLEVGCGTGDFGFSLVRAGYQGEMIDFSDSSVSAMPTEMPEGISFTRADIFNFHPRHDCFDFIIAFEVLEHIVHPEQFISVISRLLRLGGLFIFSVPARQKYWSVDDEIAGHFKRYEKSDLISLLNFGGFKIEALYSYGFPFVNWIRPLRRLARLWARSAGRLKRIKNDKIALTSESGHNIVAIPFVRLVSNSIVLYPFIKFSELFNKFDWGDGYIGIAKK